MKSITNQILINSEYSSDSISNKKTCVPINRPQSPRQFFERLYGHLENTPTNNLTPKPIISPVRSDISSSSDYIERYYYCMKTRDLHF